MDIEYIFNIFCRLTGLDKENAVRYKFLCEKAAEQILNRLISAPQNDRLSSICFAAAASACYRYLLICATDGNASEIKVGELSVRQNLIDQAEAAEKVCRQAFFEIRDLLCDEAFAFKGV